MEKKDRNQRKEKLLKCLCSIPREMIKLHGTENMTEFLLHHLAQPECFNLIRAALFVDNPDVCGVCLFFCLWNSMNVLEDQSESMR